MSNKLVPDSDHISRFCRRAAIGEDGKITETAFEPREKLDFVDGKYGLSVNWLEYFQLENREAEIDEIRKNYKIKFKYGFDKARIGILNVGNMRKKILDQSLDDRNILVEHFPLPPGSASSHSRIIDGLTLEDRLIFRLLADCIEEEHSTIASPATSEE